MVDKETSSDEKAETIFSVPTVREAEFFSLARQLGLQVEVIANAGETVVVDEREYTIFPDKVAVRLTPGEGMNADAFPAAKSAWERFLGVT